MRFVVGMVVLDGFATVALLAMSTGEEIGATLPPGFMARPVTWAPAFVVVASDSP